MSTDGESRSATWFRRLKSSPWLGVYFAMLSSIGSPIHLLTAAMIPNVSVSTVMLIRSLQHLSVFSLLIVVERPPSKTVLFKERWPLVGHSVMVALSLICIYSALYFLPSADVYVISCATPIFATLGAYLILGEKFGVAQGISAIIVGIGAIIITRPPWLFGESTGEYKDTAWIGSLLALLSCVFTTAQGLFVRKLQGTPTGIVILVAAVLLTVITAVFAYALDDFRYPGCGMPTVHLLLGGASQMLTNVFFVLAGKLLKAGRLSVIKTSSVVFTYIFQAIFMGVTPNWTSLLGGALIFFSVLCTTMSKQIKPCCGRKKSSEDPQSRVAITDAATTNEEITEPETSI